MGREDLGWARRTFLKEVAAVAGVSAVAGFVAGCKTGPAGPESVAVPLSQVPAGRRIVIHLGDEPVEVVNGPAGIRARSLRCTHWGCTVKWVEDQQRYHCPCHNGLFDAEGVPVQGPPPKPLRSLAFRLVGDTIVFPLPRT